MDEQSAATFLQKIYRGYKDRYNTVINLITNNSNGWNKLIDLYNLLIIYRYLYLSILVVICVVIY